MLFLFKIDNSLYISFQSFINMQILTISHIILFQSMFVHHRCVPKDNEFRCLANGRSDQGGCRAKWNNCIPQLAQDIDTSCQYDNDPRWFPQAMYVTESHCYLGTVSVGLPAWQESSKVKSQSRDLCLIFDEKWRSTLRLKYVGLQ
jgi:hypothetical protein